MWTGIARSDGTSFGMGLSFVMNLAWPGRLLPVVQAAR
jgi:hypothetical protein